VTASEPERARELLETAAQQARDAISELRELAAGIHPTLLSMRGLRAALEALAEESSPRRAVGGSRGAVFPPVVESTVCFLISEALTNVVKHAEATSAAVRIGVGERSLTVEVRDDGVGGAAGGVDGSGLSGSSTGWARTGACCASRAQSGRGQRYGPISRWPEAGLSS